MPYTCMKYDSPVGELTVCDDGAGICGLWLEGQKYFGMPLAKGAAPDAPDAFGETESLAAAKAWLDDYFAGKNPPIDGLTLNPHGSDFQKAVWRELVAIPFGQTTTYGSIAKSLGAKTGRRVASIAVGGAVGHNPVSIIIPCHRVVGASGSLTGYAGGLDRKTWLLGHEGVPTDGLFRPKKGTAL